MGNAESPEPRPAGIPRWLAVALAPVVGLVAIPAVHAGIPWALSHLGPRYGWADGEPAGWNLLGYVPVAVGAVLFVWIIVFGFFQCRHLPERVPVDWSPAILMTGGPYAISRHPMYIAELALWLGWAILYGSIPVLIGFVVLAAVVGLLAPTEERALEAKFGEGYRRYKARVHRWVGVARRGRVPAEPNAPANAGSASRGVRGTTGPAWLRSAFGKTSGHPGVFRMLSTRDTRARAFMRDKLHCVLVLGVLLSLLFLCSCAAERSSRSRLPAPVAIYSGAGHRGPLLVMIGLQSGEELPFLLDTGAPVTCLDESLEPRLGRRLGTVAGSNFGVVHETRVYEAPQLWLGHRPLTMSGTNVITWNFKQGPSKGPHPYVGILGMHVLLNYCIQLDFAAHRMRFLDPASAEKSAWGTPFALTDVGDGCVAIRENLVGAQGPGSIIDTGYRGDGFLTPESFQRWTNHAALALDGEMRAPEARLGGVTYPDVIYLDAESLSLGDPPRPFNGIGLYFLSRHLVTFDFPNHTMYLKRTRVAPVVDAAFRKAADEAGRLLDRLKRDGQLPGWSKKDEFANDTETVQLRAPNCVSFDQVRKKGDSSVYHYELCRPSQEMPWRLQRAWRTDQNAHTIEEYPTLDSKGTESEPTQGK